MPLVRTIVEDYFAPQAISRGKAYAITGRVEDLHQQGDRLIAQVRGSSGQAYRLTVDLSDLRIDGGALMAEDVSSECTCPVGLDCKHAVAVLTAFARAKGIDLWSRQSRIPVQPPAQPPAVLALGATQVLAKAWQHDDPDVREWIGDLQRSESRWQRSDSGEGALAYIVHFDAGGVLRFDLVTRRRLKSGRWGVGKRHQDALTLLAREGRELDELDQSLLHELGHASERWNFGRPVRPTGDFLRRLLNSGRAVVDSIDGAVLRLLPPRAVSVRWQRQRDAYRLQVAGPDGEAVEMVASQPPWYRDGDGLGPLLSDLPHDVLQQIIDMPWLSLPEAQAAYHLLRERVPGLQPIADAAPTEPEPVLRLARLTLDFSTKDGGRRVDADVAVACFRYGDDEVGETGPVMVARPDGSPLVRWTAAERRRSRELERFGLQTWPPPGVLHHGPHVPGSLIPRVPVAEVLASGGAAVAIGPAVLAGLRGSGWTIIGADVPAVAIVDLAGLTARVDERDDGDWFELHLGIDVGPARLDLVPLLTPLLRGGRAAWETLPRAAGDPPAVLVASGPDTVVRVPLALIESLHDHLVELFNAPQGPGGGWRVDPTRADVLDALDRLSPRWIGESRLRSLADRLRSCLDPPAVPVPGTLLVELRPYQRQGLAWLQRLSTVGIGGLLADDMGLGKTVQTIAHLLLEREAHPTAPPSLVVCPASMVGIWRSELARFAPTLRTAVVHGANRRQVAEVRDAAVVITSHATLARDIDAFAAQPWRIAVCDEAQAAKNANTALATALRRLDAHQRLALTGTPVENHLGELHALLSWVAPGVLGGLSAFTAIFRTPIEEQADDARRLLLRRRVAPFVLRRTKAAVADDLPERTEIDLPVTLATAQRGLYEAIRLAMDGRVRAAVAERGLARSGLDVLEALLRLRQACCDPRLLPGELAQGCAESAKLEALGELLTTLIDEGRRVLVFSQFTSLLDLVERHVLAPLSVEWLRLDGSSSDRGGLVERFQNGSAPVFLLSLKAGGTGLTLTAADTVILLDPWWNPAVERQAADRAHRIGQKRAVTIYRLVVSGTVEERIRQLQQRKAALADALMDETGQSLGRLTLADIEALMAPIDRPG